MHVDSVYLLFAVVVVVVVVVVVPANQTDRHPVTLPQPTEIGFTVGVWLALN